MNEGDPLGPSYSVSLSRFVPETRWFRRAILRRKQRSVLIFVGIPTSYQWSRSINGADAISITAESNLTWLQRRRVPTGEVGEAS